MFGQKTNFSVLSQRLPTPHIYVPTLTHVFILSSVIIYSKQYIFSENFHRTQHQVARCLRAKYAEPNISSTLFYRTIAYKTAQLIF